MQTDSNGRGVINILAADKLLQSPKVYATLLLWLLSELFEKLPEVGDPEKPKLVFFFDEAHLLFNDLPSMLQEKVEQVVRLIRSKGVGVYFVTQNPMDVPQIILGQLGNRVQHALRAFTPMDQKAVKAAAQTFRLNPKLDVEKCITRTWRSARHWFRSWTRKEHPGSWNARLVCPPHSQIGPITPEQRQQIMAGSNVAGVYDKVVDRESAYERLKSKAEQSPAPQSSSSSGSWFPNLGFPSGGGGGRRGDSLVEAMMKSTARAVGSSVGRQIVRGVLGSLLGGSKR